MPVALLSLITLRVAEGMSSPTATPLCFKTFSLGGAVCNTLPSDKGLVILPRCEQSLHTSGLIELNVSHE